MKELVDALTNWLNLGHKIALATLINIQGSSPREIGAVMAVNDVGEVIGSVSGGCVEAALVEEALAVIDTNQPKIVSYGIADELGLEVGLTCGGTIEVFVEPLHPETISPVLQSVRQAEETPFALCTLIEGAQAGAKMIVPETAPCWGSLGNAALDQVVQEEAKGLLAQGLSQVRRYGVQGERRGTEIAVFIESFISPPHLIIFGAVDFSRALCRLAKILGYRVTIGDARSRFATQVRFPEADEVIVEWPHKYLQHTSINNRTAIVVLTHDPKFDVPALVHAVATPAAYIGAMGSRKANADRIERLQEAGLTASQIERIAAPLGLDIGAKTPEETAISILAEIIALKNGRSGERLMFSANPIH